MSSKVQHSYDHSLLNPGYAGELAPDEFDFLKSALQYSSSLRRIWGFRPSAKRLNDQRIRKVARDGLVKNEK